MIQQAIASLHAYLERKASEVGALQKRLEEMDGLNHHQLALLRHALRHSGFRYSVVSHQNSHGMSHQTARNDLQDLAGRGMLIAGKDGRREVFREPEDLAARLPGRTGIQLRKSTKQTRSSRNNTSTVSKGPVRRPMDA